MTTPRYPTSAKYRRHKPKSYLVPALMGLLFGGGFFVLAQFFGSDEKPLKAIPLAENQVGEEKKPVESQIVPEGEDSSQTRVSLSPMVRPVSKNNSVTQKSSLLPPTPAVNSAPMKGQFSEKLTFTRADLDGHAYESATEELVDSDEPVSVEVPSAPSGLAPRTKDPDIEITFYEEFPRRKIVVPKKLDEEDDAFLSAQNLIEKSNTNSRRPLPPPPGSDLLGIYQVQLVIFSSQQRADDVVKVLRQQRAPAYSVMVSGAKDVFYRVRLGPFSSQAEAKWAMGRWKIKGSSPLILRQRP
ncbi:MAG: SPOR domain-containing protein [Magnetococcales bacterium]|nr:SPOR domain-containing protein [Magnetococcales bacterium]